MEQHTQDVSVQDKNINQAHPNAQVEGLSAQEIAQQESSDLPDREAMSLVNANVAAPINAAVALNALSDGSTAQAAAVQTAPINQGI
jgi:hypothetical protein